MSDRHGFLPRGARPGGALLCALALSTLAACDRSSPRVAPAHVAVAVASATSSARPAASAAPAAELVPLPAALSPVLGAEWHAERAADVAINAIARSTAWPSLGLCESECRVDTQVLAQGEEAADAGARHLVVLSVNGREGDGAGAMFHGTTIAVCTFELRQGLWTLADCREDAARMDRGYGQFNELLATVRNDGVAVEWSDWASGEEDRTLQLLRRVKGRFAEVLTLDFGADTHGNYADRPDIQTAWKATWDDDQGAGAVPDVVATAHGHQGGEAVDCKARYRFDGARYQLRETSAGRPACPWAVEAPRKAASASTASG